MKLLVALWALAGTASGLLPVIVPLNDDANGTQWGPVTADISANRCRAFAVDFAPDSLALGIVNAAAMGIEEDLDDERARRQLRLGALISERLRAASDDSAAPDIDGAARAAAIFTAIWRWAQSGPGTASLPDELSAALDLVVPRPPRAGA